MSAGASLWPLLCLSLLAVTSAAAAAAATRDWGDWIIVDETEPGTSILLRRITPKSVFVAPTFTGCSEGYRQDALGRCVKLVKVNQQAQWNFFLERLNSMYAPSSTSKNPQKDAGPFHISLPIGTENSQEGGNVKKRIPSTGGDFSTTTSTTSTTTTQSTTIPTTITTTQMPTTTVESTTTESVQPVYWKLEENENIEGESSPQPESTSEDRRDLTTEDQFDVMMGDQPVSTEDFVEAESLETPKKYKEIPTQLPEKPFVIIVTNEPTSRTEDTTTNVPSSILPPRAEEDANENVSETPSTTEVTTESTIDTNSRHTTESTPNTTEYDESVSDTKDFFQSLIRPATVQYNSVPPTVRPKCDPTQVSDGSINFSNCPTDESEISLNEREVKKPLVSLTSSSPLQSNVRFPTEPSVPVRKTQAYVRFPGDRDYWWPSWDVPQNPGVSSWWPPVGPAKWFSNQESSTRREVLFPSRTQMIPYPAYQKTDDRSGWRRRFFQRD